MANIKIILGSTRPNRFSPQPAQFLMDLAKEHPEHSYEILDLKEFNLPMLDEPMPPSMAGKKYANENVNKWSKVIDQADGFIFITPEYNHGVSSVLKNAVDVIAPEWAYKPVAFLSYGVEGGVRAVAHFRSSLIWLNMFPIKDTVMLVNYWQFLDEKGNFKPTEQHTEAANRMLERVGYWGEYLKDARKKLTQE